MGKSHAACANWGTKPTRAKIPRRETTITGKPAPELAKIFQCTVEKK
ncbi:hypothetical protein COLO4_37778 [Corchorus olitorius]|uniref:Uncharacterized protein n=1 Tax=Corchorus olitorius TaxID=93759 RepID=A0A1R3FZE0_9ROSI|nr:hypothetical protein COLO4_37778 [Corchorus olitorius]